MSGSCRAPGLEKCGVGITTSDSRLVPANKNLTASSRSIEKQRQLEKSVQKVLR